MNSNKLSQIPINKLELDNLVRLMKLSKENCVILLSFLKDKNLLDDSIDIHVYDDREKEIEHFFDEFDGTPFIKDLYGLLEWLNFNYKPKEWALYSRYKNSKLSCFLIHKPKEYDSLPLLVSNVIENPYDTLKQILEIINYREHNWSIYGDFKKEIERDFKS